MSQNDFSTRFLREKLGRAWAWMSKIHRSSLIEVGLADPDGLLAQRGEGIGVLQGRGRPVSMALPGRDNERMVLRPYIHGGLAGPLFGRLFAGSSRALGEARIVDAAVQAGVPAYVPLAALTRRSFGLFYRAWIVSLEIQGGKDLTNYLASNPDPGQRAQVMKAAGTAVRKMHDEGFYHGDLHVKNMLVVADMEARPSVHLLDWDLARRFEPMSTARRFMNLARLDRSGAKLSRSGTSVTPRDRLGFLRAYLGGDRLFSARDFLRRQRRWKFHAFLWSLGDLLR